jgi:hypothetical protein
MKSDEVGSTIICTHNQMLLGRLNWTRWVGHVACMGKMKYVYKILDRKPEEKRSVERPRHR